MKKKAKKKAEFDLQKFIIQRLRGAFRKSPLYSAAKNRAKEVFYVDSKKGKPLKRVRYICAQCGGRFFDKPGQKEIAVDHIEPVISEFGWMDYNNYINRLFCPLENLQVLCNYAGERDGKKSCHKIKTAQESAKRAEKRNSGG